MPNYPVRNPYARAVNSLAQAGKMIATIGGGTVPYYAYKSYKNKGNRGAPYKKRRKGKTVRVQKSTFNQPTNKKRVYKKKTARQATLKNEVKEIKKQMGMDTGTHIHRQFATARLIGAINVQSRYSIESISTTRIEDVLARLQYYDPSNPGTLLTASGNTGTYHKEFMFQSVYSKVSVHNNYDIPCNIRIYACRVKKDTGITPETAYTSGITDVSTVSASNTKMFLTDSDIFNDLWKIEATQMKALMPGESAQLSIGTKSFTYDPSLTDSHALTYQRSFKGLAFLIRIEGALGHDTVQSEVAPVQSGVDIQWVNTYTVKYQAGADIKRITVDQGAVASSFTNFGVVGVRPTSNNQNYSQL